MSDLLIFANNVSFNYPLQNVTQILPVYTTDTIMNFSCNTLNVSGILATNNMSCINIASINNIYTTNLSSASYITINKPIQPNYTYNVTSGTNVVGSIGYIYSSQATFQGTIQQNTWTNIIGTFPTSIVSGIYMIKLKITYKNTGNINGHPIKIQHYLGGGIPPDFRANNCFSTCVYFQNNNDAYVYTHNTIITIGPSQTLNHYICIPNQLIYLIVSASVENNTYNLSLLRIA